MASEASTEIKPVDTGLSNLPTATNGAPPPTITVEEPKPAISSGTHDELPGSLKASTANHESAPGAPPPEPVAPVEASLGLTFANATEAKVAKPTEEEKEDLKPAEAAPAPTAVPEPSTNGNGATIGTAATQEEKKEPGPGPVVSSEPTPFQASTIVEDKKPAEEAPRSTADIGAEIKGTAPEATTTANGESAAAQGSDTTAAAAPAPPAATATAPPAATAAAPSAAEPAAKPGRKPSAPKPERTRKRAATETGEPRRSKRNKE